MQWKHLYYYQYLFAYKFGLHCLPTLETWKLYKAGVWFFLIGIRNVWINDHILLCIRLKQKYF